MGRQSDVTKKWFDNIIALSLNIVFEEAIERPVIAQGASLLASHFCQLRVRVRVRVRVKP